MMVEIVPSRLTHVGPLAAQMDAEDSGVKLVRGMKPRAVLRRSFASSFYSRTALIDGRVAAMWGVAGQLLDTEGHVWLTLSPLARAKGAMGIVAAAAAELGNIFMTKDRLFTTVAAEDRRAVRWLQFWGFDLGEADARGVRCGWLVNPRLRS